MLPVTPRQRPRHHYLQSVAILSHSACPDAPCPSALFINLGFPSLDLQAAVALVRLHCRLHHLAPPSLSPRLLRLRTSYPPSPSSLEADMQAVGSTRTTPPAPPLALLYPAPSPTRVTKPRNIDHTYARSLRPAVSTLWRQRTLHPSPAAPPPPEGRPISAYTTWTSIARTCTALRSTCLLPTLASIPLSRLRCQGSVLPTHQFLSPTTHRHVPYQLRHCP